MSIMRMGRLGLGRSSPIIRMSSSFGANSQAWYQPILDVFTDNSAIGYIWSHDSGIASAIEQPVQTWFDVTNTVSLTQSGASTLRPTRKADGVFFDGVDDRILGDSIASLADDQHTILVGFEDPNNLTTSVRTLLGFGNTLSTSFLRQVIINYSYPDVPNSTRQRYLLASSVSSVAIANMDISLIGAGPYNMAYRSAGLDLDARADMLTNPLVQSGLVATRPPESEPFTFFSLGARRLGAVPTTSQFWEGKVRYLIICNKNLSDIDTLACLAALTTQGLT